MSTLKSSAEDLTLNADGSGNDVIIQSDGSTKAIVTAEGNVGIGCTPDNKLTVQDSSYKIHLGVQSADPTIHFTDSSNSTNDGVLKFYKLKFKTDGGVTNMLLDNNGNLDIKVGNLIIGTAGKGIDFSAQTATTSGTTTSEVLDHYEEGTFTLGVSGGTQTCDPGLGRYTRIGRMCYIQVYAVPTNVTDSTHLELTGLPFTVEGYSGVGVFQAANSSSSETILLRAISSTTNIHAFYAQGNQTQVTQSVTHGHWIFSFVYEVE